MLSLLRGDRSADDTVPPSGVTGHLTILAAAAMALLTVFALSGAMSAGRIAQNWAGAMGAQATLELPGTPDERAEQAERARLILGQTPGVSTVRSLTPDEIRDLLSPWIGDPSLLADEDLPLLLAIEEGPDLDRQALALRLEGELPQAILHRHDDWAARIAMAAERLRWLALGFAALALGVTAVVVTLAARASLAMHGRMIETLRLLGARDSYIARAFVRRFTLRALAGAALGTVLAVLLIFALGSGVAPLDVLRPQGAGWLAVALVPLFAALLAFFATRRAAFRVLLRIR
ncbi:cell division protein FtsX [Halovulum dunhuangense]|uniref:Cell division protein FtsX n=1 Tax=Halovulum dunhuangense TaxID=1505036 RepID=A0A849KRZ9_9RHOB|nr:FtsX-like permease family protein [Halovulum dunhuangense]NNU79649.1 cell division protein FtsX [Halovulum dunhuangense]